MEKILKNMLNSGNLRNVFITELIERAQQGNRRSNTKFKLKQYKNRSISVYISCHVAGFYTSYCHSEISCVRDWFHGPDAVWLITSHQMTLTRCRQGVTLHVVCVCVCVCCGAGRTQILIIIRRRRERISLLSADTARHRRQSHLSTTRHDHRQTYVTQMQPQLRIGLIEQWRVVMPFSRCFITYVNLMPK